MWVVLLLLPVSAAGVLLLGAACPATSDLLVTPAAAASPGTLAGQAVLAVSNSSSSSCDLEAVTGTAGTSWELSMVWQQVVAVVVVVAAEAGAAAGRGWIRTHVSSRGMCCPLGVHARL